MNFRSLWNENNLFWEAILLSLVLHFLLFHVGEISFRFHEKHTVEIDITNMGHMGMTPSAPRPAAPPPKHVAPRKEWVKPAPDQKVVPAPIPVAPVPAPPPEEPPAPPTPAENPNQEYGIGTGEGSENSLSRMPQLLNLSDLGAILNRFYPEQARAQRLEGTVVMDLHIDTDGHIQAVDIVQSGGAEFDEAVRRVAKLLRFTPAFMGSHRVAVKLRQAIQFKLRN